jgi:hypothetical protein
MEQRIMDRLEQISQVVTERDRLRLAIEDAVVDRDSLLREADVTDDDEARAYGYGWRDAVDLIAKAAGIDPETLEEG